MVLAKETNISILAKSASVWLSVGGCLSLYLVAVVLACTAELQKSVRISGSLRAAMHAVKGI